MTLPATGCWLDPTIGTPGHRIFSVIEGQLLDGAAVFGAMPYGVLVRTPDGRTVYANPAAARLLGAADAEPMRIWLDEVRAKFRVFDEDGAELGAAELPWSRLGDESVDAVVRLVQRADGRERWLSVRTRPLTESGGAPLVLVTVDDVSHGRWGRERERFFEDATRALAQSLDHETALNTMARLAVPRLADWCAIEVLEPRARHERAALAHPDPDRERWVTEDPRRFPRAWTARDLGGLERPVLVDDLEAWLDRDAGDDAQRRGALYMLELRSAAIVPLRARGRLLGTVTLALGNTSRRYSPADLDVFERLAARYAIALDNARLFRDQQRIATHLQRGLRPGRLPRVPGLDVAAMYRPVGDQAQAGGDFYDLFPGPRGTWMATIGDVSGKGVDAAATSALMRHTLRAAAGTQGSLARCLAVADETLHAEETELRLCSALLVRLAMAGGRTRVKVANAGHPPPVVVRRDGAVDVPERGGAILGVPSARLTPEESLELDAGDALVLFTDGVTEARTADGLFGHARLQEVVAACAGRPAAVIVDAVRDALAPPVSRRDDVAVLVIAVPGAE